MFSGSVDREIDLHSPFARHDMTHVFTTPDTLAALLAAPKGALRRNDATRLLDDEVATRAFFYDGYFYPGDLGMFGHDGRLSLRGRASDVINVLGDKIATDPIERALQDRLGAEGVCILP